MRIFFDDGKVIAILDQACGTGGMLFTGFNFIKRFYTSADMRLFGHDINPESYAMCMTEMLIKGQNAENMRYQGIMKADCFQDTKIRFVFEILRLELLREARTQLKVLSLL